MVKRILHGSVQKAPENFQCPDWDKEEIDWSKLTSTVMRQYWHTFDSFTKATIAECLQDILENGSLDVARKA